MNNNLDGLGAAKGFRIGSEAHTWMPEAVSLVVKRYGA